MRLADRVFAGLYDRVMVRAERAVLQDHRRALLAAAAGDVLEIGGGTGANLPHYGAEVRALTLTEPDASMLARLQKRAAALASPATVLRAPAEDLPFADASFDTVVSTLVLCGVADQPRALHELHRVLRPTGKLLFIEHVLSDDPGFARMQRRLNGINRWVAHCHCTRATVDAMALAGFEIGDLTRDEMRKAPLPTIRPLAVGVAVRRST